MFIFENLTCENCKNNGIKLYKLDVDSELNNKIICSSCSDSIYSKPKVELNTEELNQKLYLNYFNEDMLNLIPLFTDKNLELDNFFDSEGIDIYKLYYQGNDLKLCEKLREISYICLDYLDTNEKDYIELCLFVIKKYLYLRLNKINDSEIENYINLLNKKELAFIRVVTDF